MNRAPSGGTGEQEASTLSSWGNQLYGRDSSDEEVEVRTRRDSGLQLAPVAWSPSKIYPVGYELWVVNEPQATWAPDEPALELPPPEAGVGEEELQGRELRPRREPAGYSLS